MKTLLVIVLIQYLHLFQRIIIIKNYIVQKTQIQII